MDIKYRVIKVSDNGQRTIVKSFDIVQDAISFHQGLKNGAFSFYEIDVFYSGANQ